MLRIYENNQERNLSGFNSTLIFFIINTMKPFPYLLLSFLLLLRFYKRIAHQAQDYSNFFSSSVKEGFSFPEFKPPGIKCFSKENPNLKYPYLSNII